ncbi:hypothetical protein FS837_000314 [Tulasnella sp. UAMH 9824]|nr:hypothetical protein FS837_000314 [Tulasnella sp. UAMH 9824]
MTQSTETRQHLLTFPTTFPKEYETPAPPRLQALYSNVYLQKQSNPEGFQSSIGWWTNTLETVVKKGAAGNPNPSRAIIWSCMFRISLRRRWSEIRLGGRLGSALWLEELAADKSIIALPTFLKSAVSIHYQPSLAYRVASFLVGRPLGWA